MIKEGVWGYYDLAPLFQGVILVMLLSSNWLCVSIIYLIGLKRRH
jgi:hypothetical protein